MTKLRVAIFPFYDTEDRAEGGIRRVVEAQVKYLPEYEIEVVRDLSRADVINGHGVIYPTKSDLPFVSSCHGLHWSNYKWGAWAHEVNGAVISALTRADVITSPSLWVTQAISRGMYAKPRTIYHGVEADEWAHKETPANYILWNKARIDPVSDPTDLMKLAELLPEEKFYSTIGEKRDNLHVFGVVPLPKLKPIIQRASIYLATTRETFGIGTLEAMAAGVPIVGWDYGGQSEIIKQGETGYLAPYGDYEALAEAIRKARAERSRLSKNCVADVRARWGWEDKIAQYAEAYRAAYNSFHHLDQDGSPFPKIGVIMPCYNMARFIGVALESLIAQSETDWECVIIDDHSTDQSAEIAQAYAHRDRRIRYYRPPNKVKLVGALNLGAKISRAKYLINFDPDNLLPPDALRELAGALDEDRGIHIAYGALDTCREDGSEIKRNPFPHPPFDWYKQIAHINQIHSGAMMRREVRELSGGYRERQWRAEDAEFWARVTSLGFRAKYVTDKTTLIYRFRSDSKSAGEQGDGNWLEFLSFALAADAYEGSRYLSEHGSRVRNPALIPFGAQGAPHINKGFAWGVPHHQAPLISVVIPIGGTRWELHKQKVIDALDSLFAQDFMEWEAIVVNDTPDNWQEIAGAPYARIVRNSGKRGAGAARNAGIKAARGKFIYFIDADDYLMPNTLSNLLTEYAHSEAGYIYSAYVQEDHTGTRTHYQLDTYDQHQWKGQHGINILIAKADLLRVGGFDEAISGWEDWELFIKLAINGICGFYSPLPAYVYRMALGDRRETSHAQADQLLPILRERYADYYEGKKPMTNCCGGDASAILAAKAAIAATHPNYFELPPEQSAPAQSAPTSVRLEFIGEQIGAQTYHGFNGRTYRGGNNHLERFIDAHPDDVNRLCGFGVWQIVTQPPAPVIMQAEAVAETPPIIVEVRSDPAPEQEAPKPKTKRSKK